MPPKAPQFPPGNDDLLSKGPCPNCGSSDACATYADGHTHCFSCGVTGSAGEAELGPAGAPKRNPGSTSRPSELLKPDDPAAAFRDLDKRGLKSATLRRFGYFRTGFKDHAQVQVAPYFGMDGEPACQKVRLPNKEFVVLKAGPDAPSIGECQLFGRHVFGDRYDRKVVVTTGEIDAMSVAQEMDFKIACVSVNAGDKQAAKNLKANYLWLDRFEEIVLWFDADEKAQAVVDDCARLFKVGKVKIAKTPEGFKDASDLLQADRPGDITTTIYAATTWRPAGIVNAAANPKDVLAPTEEDGAAWRFEWHRPEYTDMLGPILPAQVVYHVAGTGIGKSTELAELEYDLFMRQGARVAHLGFEDTRRDTKLRLMNILVSDRLDIEPRPDAEMTAIHAEVFGHGRLELFDPETAEWSMEAILGYVRYCAKALDCQVVVVDPLSFIAAGLDVGADERRALDRVSKELAQAAKELGIHIQVSHHLSRPEGTPHEEGAPTSLNQVRGSGGIANFASIVIGHERNTQAGEGASLITQMRALKNRPRSRTGVFCKVAYDLTTGRLKTTSAAFPGPPSKGGREQQRGGGFPPAGVEAADY